MNRWVGGSRRWIPWAIGLAATLAVAAWLRLGDPLSSPVIPAEDPYTHMALVREHLRTGSFGALYQGGRLYPPGMHALLAAAWVLGGVDLYGLFRFAPLVFGVVGVLGMGLLLTHLEGPEAGVLGAFGYAIAPEVVLRTSMMAPTAVDLALLPFLLLALVLVLEGRLAWIPAAAVLAAFLVFSHPWVFGILALTSAVLLVLLHLLGWPAGRSPAPTTKGVVVAGSIVALGFALAALGCWGACGPGFGVVIGLAYGRILAQAVVGVFAVVAVALALLVVSPQRLDFLAPPARQELRGGWIWSLVVGALLVAGTLLAYRAGLPRYVGARMPGWPLLLAAMAGVLVLPQLRSRAALLGAAVFFATYPFVITNPFHSPYWPHRTAAYLIVGLAILGGVATARAIGWVTRGVGRSVSSRRRVAPVLGALIPVLLVTSAAAGAYVGTPDAGAERWYRLYTPCGFHALQATSDRAAANPDAVVVTGDWRPKLVLAALTPDAPRVWFTTSFYTNASQRQGTLTWLEGQHRPVYVVVDPNLVQHHHNINVSFLQGSQWTPVVNASCGPSGPRGDVTTYQFVSSGSRNATAQG